MRFLFASALALAGLSFAVADGADGFIIQIGTSVPCSRKTKKGDKIAVNYNGTFTNYQVFDSSYPASGPPSPFVFKIGSGPVIKGWQLGLLDMCVGDIRKIFVPPAFGYGNNTVGNIPANTLLLYYVELVQRY
ncbi:hypothetical protein VTL71DRAFT_5630 [Oculimacula yallundae]|uniref:peptidylprolyl isomerase n=1 Tax=Oculimacula yallundae TaxID=86028 RepID=A0ABR4C1N5_9HELO